MYTAAFLENILTGAEAEGISVREALQRMKDAGLQKLYFSPQGMEHAGGEEKLLDVLKELGLGVEGLHCWFDLPHHPEDEGYKKLIDLAVRAGAGNVLIVPGMIPKDEGARRAELLENMRAALVKAVAYGHEKGVDVSMEDFDGLAAPFCTADGLDWFMQNVHGLKCSFDTGNFVMYHEDETAAFERFRDKICTMHLKDRGTSKLHEKDWPCVCADGVTYYPTPVGTGFIRIAEIIDRLKERGYDGGLIVEIYGCEGEYMLESIAQSIRWVNSRTV